MHAKMHAQGCSYIALCTLYVIIIIYAFSKNHRHALCVKVLKLCVHCSPYASLHYGYVIILLFDMCNLKTRVLDNAIEQLS